MNLLELARSYLPGDVVGQVSTMLNENQRDTQTAINGALPAILGGLIQKSTEAGGPGMIVDMVSEVMTPNRAAGEVITPEGGVFSQLGSMFDGSNTQMSRFMSMGAGLITSLFGGKAEAVASALATHSGIKQTSASSLLSLAGPVVLGVLGKRMVADGDGPGGVAGLLNSQAGNVQAAMPTELGSLLSAIPGMEVTGGPGSQLASLESRPSNTDAPAAPLPVAPVPTPPTSPVDRPVAGIPAYSNDHTSSGSNRWLPWLLLALGIAALLYFLRG